MLEEGGDAGDEMPVKKHREGEAEDTYGVRRTKAVGEALRRSLAGLGLANQLDDAGLGAVARGAGHLGLDHAPGVQRAAEDGVAGRFFHRDGFAGEGRFIRGALAFRDPAVGGKLLAGQDADDRAGC